jgi:ATP phosphoribosyltransferase
MAVLTRIAAEEEARTTREVRAALDPSGASALSALVQKFGASLPYGIPQGREVVIHCRAAAVFEIVAALQAIEGRDIAVRAFDYLFRPTNALTERLLRRIG